MFSSLVNFSTPSLQNMCPKQQQIHPKGQTTSNPRRFDVGITSIRRRPNFDELPRHFHVLFRCNFADRKIHVVSTYFSRRKFNSRKINVFSTYFFRRNSMVKKSTLFPCFFFDVISLVEKFTLFLLTFFDVILMVEKSHLFFSAKF